jgi:hypothetical protein
MLATDPHVRVNGGPPRRLTKTPVDLEVPSGMVTVEVALFRSGFDEVGFWAKPLVRRLSPNPISSHVGEIAERGRLRLRFHPAVLESIHRKGRLRVE